MKKQIKYILTGLFGLCMIGCSSDDNKETPSDIKNIESIAGPGYINLKWDYPDDGSVFYTKVKYYDHLKKKDMVRLSSIDTIRIPNTRNKYGEYEFFLQTYSKTDTPNSNIHSIKAISGKKPITEVANLIKLTEEQLSTNAQEPSEGPIKNLLDGNTGTFFHTQWSAPVPAGPHWMQIELSNSLQVFRFQYDPRNNGNNKPTNFDLLGSMDGEEWFLIKNFTKEADGLPVTATDGYKSPTIKSEKPFKFLRFSVNKTNSGSIFWTMSEFRLYDVDVIDPEAPDVEVTEEL